MKKYEGKYIKNKKIKTLAKVVRTSKTGWLSISRRVLPSIEEEEMGTE